MFMEVEYLQVGQLVGLVGHLDGGCGCVFGGCGVAEYGATAPDVEWLGLLEPRLPSWIYLLSNGRDEKRVG